MDKQASLLRRSRLIWLVSMIVGAAVFGAADLFWFYSDRWSMVSEPLSVVLGVVAVVMICRYDSRLVSYPLTTRLVVWIILLALVAIPYYLVRSRGWKGALKMGLGIPFMVIPVGAYYAAWWISARVAVAIGYYS